jgi:hypothetical protein
MTIEAFSFGLADVKVAAWNSAENWGTAVDVEAVQMFGLRVNTVNGTLEGDDIIADAHAKIISATIRCRFGFKDLTVLSTLTGLTETESLPNTKNIIIASQNMPYVAIHGRIDHTSGGGALGIFIPKFKLMEGFELNMQYGQYMTPEVTGLALYDSATYGIGKIITYTTAASVTIPPS